MTVAEKAMDREKVMKRVQKLLNLATGNPNENEAQNALLKAQAYMAEHNISMKEVSDVEAPTIKKEVKESQTKYFKHAWYKKGLASLIANNFRCFHFYRHSGSGKTSIVFFGLKEDAELAQTMYEFAVQAIEWNADQYVKEARKERYIRDATGVKNDYMKGFIRGLSEKFRNQVKEMSLALVLVKDEALVEAHKALKLRKGSASKGGVSAGDSDAYEAGKQKGKSFEAASGYIK